VKRTLVVFTAVLAAYMCWSLALAGPPAATAPATAPTTAPATQPAAGKVPDGASLRTAGLAKALAGDFKRGLEMLSEASRLSPGDKTAADARGLLQDYLKHLADSEAQRAAEYKQAANRVELYLLAQDYMPKLAAAKIDQKLRAKAKEAVLAYNKGSSKVASVQSAEEAAAELRTQAATDRQKAADLRREVAQLKAQSAGDNEAKIEETEALIANLEKEAKDALKKAESLAKQASQDKAESLGDLDKATAGLKEAQEMLKGDSGDYAKTFRELSASAMGIISDFRGVWEKSEAGGAAEAKRRAEKLKGIEENLAEARADISVMVDEQPWQAAMVQARIAKQLAAPADKPDEQPWYRSLVALAEARGSKAVAEARWYDAMDAYSGLNELEEDSEDYIEKVKNVQRHVRVLELYVPRAAAGGPSSRPAEQGEETWQHLVDRVDAEMVRSAISQLDLYYVTSVDYRKVAKAAMLGLRVLAETPQAAETFKGLADNEKKQKFLDAVAGELENIEKRDRVDHMDLQFALNAMIRASERSVGIPTNVIAVEFTEGLLSDLDKFSAMIWPHDVTDFHKNTMGHFVGVGIQITKEPGEPLKVVTPLADSPALKAGIRAGDIITAVDGTPTKNLNVNRVVDMIMGEKGTKVVLTIDRPGRPALIDFEVIREEISIGTVKGWRRDPGGKWRYLVDPQGTIAYVQVTQFTDKTPREISEALADINKELADKNNGKLQSLVLDLRFNPGGRLESATSVTDEFLNGGVIVTTEGRQKRPATFRAHEKGSYLGGNLIVLVNEHSASAAEIVSGAIKDRKRGVVVGGRTFGKGSVQNVIPIRNDKALLKLTTAYYYLPSGRLLHRKNGQKEWGVDPDVEIKFTPKQTRRWLEIRNKTGLLLTESTARPLDEDLKKQHDEDIQLQTAMLLLKLMQLQGAQAAA